ncbi:MAG: FAD-binding oxidoreductase [Alphaproteobacteria bacterium]|nr:FAD-binding oxidoreductase [Alphaproteobacteria bacterium]
MAGTETHHVVVIGAGIVGCCTAFELAKRGVKDVLVLEKGTVASGPTGRSSGILRQFYTHPTLVQMARQGLQAYASCRDETGYDAGFTLTGWLLVVNQASEPVARNGLDVQQHFSVPSRWLSVEDIAELVPDITTADLIGGVYEADSGYGDPAGAANAFLSRAREMGVVYRPDCELLDWAVAGPGVIEVVTSQGKLQAGVVLNCAGSWVPGILERRGCPIPVSTSRHQIITVREAARPTRPIVSDPLTYCYIRPEGRDLTLIGSSDPADAEDVVDVDACPSGIEATAMESLVSRARRRLPALEDAGIAHGWSGVYDVSADGFPILGPVPGVEGMVLATGLSGHGFKLAPAIAEILASFVTDSIPDSRAQLFRWSRFAEGDPIRSITTSALTTMKDERTTHVGT